MMNGAMRTYSTGLPFLDQRLDGGLPVGSLLAITAPPQSQSEAILREFVQTRPTVYLSTVKPEREVERWASVGNRSPPALSVESMTQDALLATTGDVADQIPPESFVVLDQVNGLETSSREEYLAVLDALKTGLEQTDSVGVLHCTETMSPPPLRPLTLARADQVWEIELLRMSRELKTRLLVTKSRYGRALREPINIILTDRVAIDTSRKIA